MQGEGWLPDDASPDWIARRLRDARWITVSRVRSTPDRRDVVLHRIFLGALLFFCFTLAVCLPRLGWL